MDLEDNYDNSFGHIELKWRMNWTKNKIFETDPDFYNPNKFFITVAFPYPNSPQHIGHGRTYALADVHARYMRMKGYTVLFPMGFHYTGTPILAMAKRVQSKDTDLLDTFRKIYGLPDDVIESFLDPLNIAKYFHNEIKLGMKEMGCSIDWRREFTTIDTFFTKFITWQFETLRQKGLVVQGSHPVGWCPNDENPVSQHDTIGDVEPEHTEYITIKYSFVDNPSIFLPCATLRPETIFGVTNLWINPEIIYHKISIDDEIWIVSKEAVKKLEFLNHKIDIIESISGNDLIYKFAYNPITKEQIPILPANFVKSDSGTGIVMSVPGHAPFDFQALQDLKQVTNNNSILDLSNINPKKIIKLTVVDDDSNNNLNDIVSLPTQEIIVKLDIKNQDDPNLDKATNDIYALEFYKGIMMENTGKYSGLPVKDAKEKIKDDLLTEKNASIMYELTNKPVYCRCGSECFVKLLNDQWFLDYGNINWKNLVKDCVHSMIIMPDEIKQEFINIIDWLKERACARKSGLGTKLPWDNNWIIESLSDSVIYMAYYILAKFINTTDDEKSISKNLQNIDRYFFDYIFLNVGTLKTVSEKSGIAEETIQKIKNEFLYFYPVDSRHSGRDLVPNHLSFYIFNHVAIFDKNYWPRQIVVNGSVLMDGKKMSKSIGNIIPLRNAIKQNGADSIRVSILISSELLQDADFSFETVKSIKSKLSEFYNFSSKLLTENSDRAIILNQSTNNNIYQAISASTINQEAEEEKQIHLEDRWMISRLEKFIMETSKSMDNLRVREALHKILYLSDQEFQWYKKRVKSKNRIDENIVNLILLYYVRLKLLLIAPFTPHLSEELWEKFGNMDSLFLYKHKTWPQLNESNIDSKAEESENLIINLISDINNILKVIKLKPKKIFIYTSSYWKHIVYSKILNIVLLENEKNFGAIMKKIANDPLLNRAKQDPNLIKKILDDILSTSFESRTNQMQLTQFDEKSILDKEKSIILDELNFDDLTIEIYSEDDENIYDPKIKSKFARPFKPAIYVE